MVSCGTSLYFMVQHFVVPRGTLWYFMTCHYYPSLSLMVFLVPCGFLWAFIGMSLVLFAVLLVWFVMVHLIVLNGNTDTVIDVYLLDRKRCFLEKDGTYAEIDRNNLSNEKLK